ncbi:Cu-binding protein [Saccharomycopsis crataegensis]|uniref:Cu-binding protein n=1 Tax=Saccharomycopsis crataegensis TaxID=43959 RepID=A0AAV5QJL0_9ASCO|nr:Cu-binding protein [Saccharomycopsis crataegensis]
MFRSSLINSLRYSNRASVCRSSQFLTPSTRLFSSCSVLKNSSASTEPSTAAPKKRKQLSRIAIGGSDSKKEKLRDASSIEFSTWKAGVLLLVVGSAMVYYFKKEKKRLDTQREAEANRGYGKPLIGGPFNLVDDNGKPFTEKNLLGKWSLVYFGFTHCPDICPDELDKMAIMLDKLEIDHNIDIQPIFITCDPARDSPEVMKEYLSEFHPKMIGLTGEYEDIKSTCKKYRVYFSTPKDVKPNQDYLVDHSIFFYLMDPEGQFVDALGRNYDENTAVEKIKQQVDAYIPKDQREKRKEGWFSFLYN